MVCSVSRPSSSRYSHSTPIAMKDLELGSTSFSSFKMNLPVSRFLTAENGRRQPPRHDHSGAGAGHVGREAGRVHRTGEGRGGEQILLSVPATLCQGPVCARDGPDCRGNQPRPLLLGGATLPRALSWICPHRRWGCKGFTQPLSGPPPCNLIRATLSCTPPPPPGHRAGVRLPAIGWAYVQLKSSLLTPTWCPVRSPHMVRGLA